MLGNGCNPGCGSVGTMGVVLVPLGTTGGNGGTGGSGGVTSAPNVVYAPGNGSLLAGATNAGAALDKIAELLVLLNNAGFATAADGTIPVYDSATGQFVPTAAGSLLDPAAMDALLTQLYVSGAPGAILQKAADGSIDAVPLPTALAAAIPGTAGQVLKYNGTTNKWEAGNVTLSPADFAALLSALTPATATNPIANIPGVDASGAPVSATPAAIVGAGLGAAPAASSAADIDKIVVTDASGAVLDASPLQLAEKIVADAPAATATNPLTRVLGVDAAGQPVDSAVLPLTPITSGAPSAATTTGGVLTTVAAPADGRYMLRVFEERYLTSTAGEAVGAGKRAYAYMRVLKGTTTIGREDSENYTPSFNTMPPGAVFLTCAIEGSYGPFDLVAGDTFSMDYGYGSGPVPLAGSLTDAKNGTTMFDLIRIPSYEITAIS